MALEQEGFKILNNITWQKTNPAPIYLVVILPILLKPFYGPENDKKLVITTIMI